MMRGRLARAALRCYPPATRTARGAEMLDTLLEASDDRRGVFVWNIVSLVAAGLGARAGQRPVERRPDDRGSGEARVDPVCVPVAHGRCGGVDRATWMASRQPGLVLHGWAADRPLRVVARTPAPRRRDRLRVHGGGGARRCAPARFIAGTPARFVAASVDRATDRAGVRVSDHGDRSDRRASERARSRRARRARCGERDRRREAGSASSSC